LMRAARIPAGWSRLGPPRCGSWCGRRGWRSVAAGVEAAPWLTTAPWSEIS
jgi:hypothetical protein